jgi:hypothetical protein
MDLVKRINDFIAKKIHVSEEEAERMGIKIPPLPKDPGKQKDIGVLPPKKNTAKIPGLNLPKKTKTNQPVLPKLPGGSTARSSRYSGAAAEAARQLTPKPGYHSPYDLAEDWNETNRLYQGAKKFLSDKTKSK